MYMGYDAPSKTQYRENKTWEVQLVKKITTPMKGTRRWVKGQNLKFRCEVKRPRLPRGDTELNSSVVRVIACLGHHSYIQYTSGIPVTGS